MSVQRRRNEISILLSRGATQSQIVGMAALEGLLIGLLALAIGLPASQLVAQMVTRTRTFLDFSAHSTPQIGLTGRALSVGLIAIGLGLVAQIAPTIGAARHTVVSYKRERARRLRAPLWQRIGLDFILLVPAAYGTYLLDQQEGLAPLGRRMDTSDPFQNPLLFLIPILTFSALTLLLVRVFPLIVSALAWIVSQTRSVSLVLAARQLSRMPGFYAAPLVLLTMTLSLSVFISSAAHSLDRYLYDQERYRLGAEMVLRPDVDSIELQEADDETTQGAAQARVARWFYAPLTDYLQVPGVRQAARVVRYNASPVLGGVQSSAVFMGVDRATTAQVAYWRQDFADDSLGALMNALAVVGNGVLAPRGFMGEHGLDVGDPVRLSVRTYGQETELLLSIVGSFDLFPTWNPKWGALFVGNLDYLFEQLGTELPATLWLRVDPAVDPAQVKENLQRLNPHSVVVQPLFARIAAEQQRPERQGLVGIFSVGFLSAASLAALGFALYAAFSFRRRSIELGILQSIGMSFWQMTGYLAWELFFLVLVGLAGGTWLGTSVSRIWIPHFRIGDIALSEALPLSVQVAWMPIYGVHAVFGLLLVAVLTLSAITIRRFKISDAVKLIEAT
jgi:putative ABC transport system permease protein